jgi:7-cyano-7-deazaguanine synthase
MSKAIVLLSGGLDSSVLLAKVVKEHQAENVIALNIYYGQKHAKELECAKYQAEWHNVRYIEANLSDVFKFDKDCPLLINGKNQIPHESYAEQLRELGGSGTVSTYVPFRNGLFLAYAASVALQLGAGCIYYGAHSDDAAGSAYPDCTGKFINNMNRAIYYGTGDKVTLGAPFWDNTKADIVRLGIELGVDFAHTWSCYEGKDKPCGVCGTCIDRLKAFESNGLKDPAML